MLIVNLGEIERIERSEEVLVNNEKNRKYQGKGKELVTQYIDELPEADFYGG